MTTLAELTLDDFVLPSLYRWERERPSTVFMTQPLGGGEVQDITWQEAADQARRMASWITAQGWPAGSHIAILGKNSAHWILADLAIWMAGHVSVPIYPTFNADALRYILEHSESKACFIGKLDDTGALASGVPSDCKLITLPLAPMVSHALAWDALLAQNQRLAGEPQRGGDELATILYTSGTTGNPKGVMHSFAALAWTRSPAIQRVPFSSSDRYFSYLPLAHAAERLLVEVGTLRYGARIFFAESLDTFAKDLARARPTVFFSVPRLWLKFQQGIYAKLPPAKLARLLKIPIVRGIVKRKLLTALGLDQCRLAVGGAAPMPPDLLRFYRDLGLELVEGYGMTENCAISHATLVGSFRPGTVGMPYMGVECRIDAATGEVQMRSPALMMGYYKDPEQTASAYTEDGWLRTGDKGELEQDGCLRITGRVKDIFKTSKGKYVAPAPIEDLLVSHPDVEACAVTGANFAQPLALLMLSQITIERVQNPAHSATERAALTQSLQAHLTKVNAQLQAHEKLDALVVITSAWTPENGMVTPTLKVKRSKIEDLYASQFDSWLKQNQPVVWA